MRDAVMRFYKYESSILLTSYYLPGTYLHIARATVVQWFERFARCLLALVGRLARMT